MTDFDAAFRRVVKRRYGHRPHRIDRGVDTMYGIDQRTYTMWRSDHRLGWGDVRAISHDELHDFYLERFWHPAYCEDLPAEIREIHLDAAVCHHLRRAGLLLQQAARVEEFGGNIGHRTLSAVSAMVPSYLLARYIACRYHFYGEILARDYGEIANVGEWFSGMRDFG